jgi:ribosomal protein L31E
MNAWRKDKQLARIRERVTRRKGAKAARVAVAKRLAEIIWHKLTKRPAGTLRVSSVVKI